MNHEGCLGDLTGLGRNIYVIQVTLAAEPCLSPPLQPASMPVFVGGSSSTTAAAAPAAAAPADSVISDIAEFSRFPWLVRVRDLQVIGAFGYSEGIPYTYLALNIGKLHYYPAVLQQRYLPDWDDFLCEPHEAMQTSR